jgi:hypothetical protein
MNIRRKARNGIVSRHEKVADIRAIFSSRWAIVWRNWSISTARSSFKASSSPVSSALRCPTLAACSRAFSK